MGAAQIFDFCDSHPSITQIRDTRFRRSVLSSRFATRHSIPYASSPVTKIRSYVFCSNNEASDEDRKIYVSFLRVEFSKIAFDAAESNEETLFLKGVRLNERFVDFCKKGINYK